MILVSISFIDLLNPACSVNFVIVLHGTASLVTHRRRVFCEVTGAALRGALISLVPAVPFLDIVAVHVTACHLHADECASARRDCGYASQL